MSRKIIPSVLLAALAGFSPLALAQADLPAAVGRISSVQGQVTLTGEDEPVAATLNWPVTGASHLTTASGGRTEFRIGSTAVRLDGDSDLEISELDDDLLRLRLNYGSVSIRVRSPELLRDFELTTPQARVTLLEPGLLRVDVERVPDTSQVSVLAGSARVDGAGSSVTVNVGRQVDVSTEDVRTSVARRDGFDVWADERDRIAETSVSSQFVSSGMTGYEELDRNGSWTTSAEYGPLWTPNNVALDWAPYRDGRWTWLAPWGWTWVDNAPWGYAPSHYGRWVMVSRRWHWAPGRPAGRPVWAPALVGWVGGNNFGHAHRGPGLGWFPLSPRERFVPGYRVSSDHERRLSWTHNGKPFAPRPARDDRRDGLTVLPRDQFEGRHTVRVNRGEQFVPRPGQVRNVTQVQPPRPNLPLRTGDGHDRRGPDRNGDGRPDRDYGQRQQPGRVITAPSQPQPSLPGGQRGPGRSQTTSTLAPGQVGTPDAPAQTINPRDVGIELHSRPNQGRPGNGANVTPAPVMQIGPTARERFQRAEDDNRRSFRQRDEQRERQREIQRDSPRDGQRDGQRDMQRPSRPENRPLPQAQPQQQIQAQPQRPQPQPQQFQPQPQPQRPQPQPQTQPQAQPAPRPAAQPAPQPRQEPRRPPESRREEGGRERNNRPSHPAQ